MIIPLDTLIEFFIISILLGLTPGPDNIFVLTQSILHGRNRGLMIVLGLCSGLVLHTIAVALGVAVVIQTSDIAFNALKLFGVCYLLYLAWQAFRASSKKINFDNHSNPGLKSLYLKGMLMSTSNPKLVIFFLAFLPQFADPKNGSMVIQLIILGALFILSAAIVMSGVALIAGYLGPKLAKSNKAQNIMHKFASLVFLSLALKLLFTNR